LSRREHLLHLGRRFALYAGPVRRAVV